MVTMSTAKCFKYLYYILNFISIVLCFTLFFWLMENIWKKYKDQSTTMILRPEIEQNESVLPPCVTVCPWRAFRAPGTILNSLH